jgi:hypothetical protein
MRKLGPVIVLAGALVLSACGSGQKHDTVPAADVIAAATSTQKTPSERMHQDISMKIQGHTIDVSADGAYDNRTHTGRSTMDMSDLAKQANGELGPPANGRGEVLTTAKPTTIYMRIPLYSKLLKIDKPWVKFDLQALGQQQGLDLNSLISSGSSDPTQSLDQLRGASGPVEVIGSEQVRGVSTSHYRATLDLRRTAALAPASKRAAAKQSAEKLIKLGASPEIKADIWVSPSDKRVHRFESQYSYKVQGHKIEVDQKVDLFDFGVKVPAVEAPPVDQTADLAELVKQRQGGGTTP